MAFDIKKYLGENKIELGSIKKAVGTHVSKGVSDIRKTQYDVKITDGKFDLYTHNEIMTESSAKNQLNERQGGTSEIAEIFARFLMGDREVAIKQLKKEIGTGFANPKPGGTAEWNKQFAELIKKLTITINAVL